MILNVFRLKNKAPVPTKSSTVQVRTIDPSRILSPLTVAVSNIEKLYEFIIERIKMPRVIDTFEGQFWVSHFLLETILSRENTGTFLCRISDTKLKSLRDDVHVLKAKKAVPVSLAGVFSEKSEGEILKEELLGKGKGTSRSRGLNAPLSVPSKALSTTSSSSTVMLSEEALNKKLLTGNSLFQKLQLAKASAKAESDLQALENEKVREMRRSRTKSLKKATSSNSNKLRSLSPLEQSNVAFRNPGVSKLWSDVPPPPKDRGLAMFAQSSSGFDIKIPEEVSKAYAQKVLAAREEYL
jgi:hypothetical protein